MRIVEDVPQKPDYDASVVTVELSKRDLAAIRYTMSAPHALVHSDTTFVAFRALATMNGITDVNAVDILGKAAIAV